MRNIYKGTLTIIGILISICSIIGVCYFFYEERTGPGTEVAVVDELSINYINGSKITPNNTYNFSITNNGDKDIYFNITASDLTHYNTGIKYHMTSSDAKLNITDGYLEKDNFILADSIFITSKSTQNFTLKVEDAPNFNLEIKKINDSKEYFFATIIKNNPPKKQASSKVGEGIATTNEGIIEDVDDYGTTYYFRGNVPNNYMNFAGNLWRIVRINGDGTVKLVLNTPLNELASYNNNTVNFEDLASTSIATSLNTYYNNNLKEYDNYIASSSKYCTESGNNIIDSKKTYNGYTRLITNKIPTFNCLGETYTSKIGLLTADEVVYAGSNLKDENKEYYLYQENIEENWWTSTLATSDDTSFYPFSISGSGVVNTENAGTLFRSLRPTINIIRKVIVTGDGTINNPYEISSD